MTQREIKFRGWFQGINGQEYWAYGYLVKQTNGNWEITNGETSWTVDDVGQFTGLKDKNGKEIYEGDVYRDTIEYEDQPDEYLYFICSYVKSQSAFCWVLNADYELGFHELDILPEDIEDYSTVSNYDLDKIQIIGNIYEKPELLK